MMSAIAATTADVQPLSRTSIGLSSSGADPHQLRYRCRSRSYLSRVRLARLRRRPVAAAVTPGPTIDVVEFGMCLCWGACACAPALDTPNPLYARGVEAAAQLPPPRATP